MQKLKSRKFIMAIATAILVILNQGLDLDLPEDSIMQIVGLVISYIVTQGYIDSKK